MIKVRYSKVCGRCVQSEPLTSGMVGQPIHFEYSHDFDGLSVTAVFTDGKNTVDVVNPGNECIIPHEVLTTVGAMVKVGIYAVRGNELVIPTIYAHIGVVLKGADPSGDVSIDPTLPIWAQTQALIGNLSQIETETKDSLVAAINEVKQTADRKAKVDALAPVATSGNYNDLTDKPTIPTVLPNPHKLTINGTEYDGSTDVQMTIEGGGGSVPKPLTYDYMPEGYPTKSGWSIEWDGNTDGLVSAAGEFYKVSDMVPTDDELIGATMETSEGESFKLSSTLINAITEDITVIGEGLTIIVRKDNATFNNVPFPQKGTYFTSSRGIFTSKLNKQTTTPMAEEFLPSILEINSIIIKSSTADSTKKFKITVDDTGTLSATEVTA